MGKPKDRVIRIDAGTLPAELFYFAADIERDAPAAAAMIRATALQMEAGIQPPSASSPGPGALNGAAEAGLSNAHLGTKH